MKKNANLFNHLGDNKNAKEILLEKIKENYERKEEKCTKVWYNGK